MPDTQPNSDAGTDAAAALGFDGSYGEAMEELEELLDELENSDVDVDLLAQRVARGATLVRFCRARLEVVTNDVDDVVAELISVDPATREAPSEFEGETDAHPNSQNETG